MTLVDAALDEALGCDEPEISHIAKGWAKAMEAYIEGNPIEALCGEVIVPHRDPARYPYCDECVRIFKEMTGLPSPPSRL